MVHKKKTKSGYLVVDGTVPVLYKKVAQTSDWDVECIKKTHYNLHDDSIAKIYGKGTRALFTHDKDAFKENVDGGFIGYFIYDSDVEKADDPEYTRKLAHTFSSFTSSKITGYIVHTKKEKEQYEKYPIPKKK